LAFEDMSKRDLLLLRLTEIGRSVAESGHAMALIGLGSVGEDTQRLDDYSDLDFFLVVESGFKQRYVDNLDWLSVVAPLAYHFRNTADGCKVLYSDGVFCEFAVFEPSELPHIPFAPGRIVWKGDGVDGSISIPVSNPRSPDKHGTEWMLGEALTNLYVGLCRYRRGEKLSAARLVQQVAVDRILDIVESQRNTSAAEKDPFSSERRIELRYPELGSLLPGFMQGYDRTPESAEAILDHLCSEHAVNEALECEIRRLCRGE
jgi:hypothetical protein